MSAAMQYLLPAGKGLNEVSHQQKAITRSGSHIDIKKFCDELKAPVDAVKTLLIGTEVIHTEDVIRNRLAHNADLAAACSGERASTLILRDPNVYSYHGALLFHLYRQDPYEGIR